MSKVVFNPVIHHCCFAITYLCDFNFKDYNQNYVFPKLQNPALEQLPRVSSLTIQGINNYEIIAKWTLYKHKSVTIHRDTNHLFSSSLGTLVA